MALQRSEIQARMMRMDALTGVKEKDLHREAVLGSGGPEAGYNSSSYGWHVDPSTGKMAFNEGLDFMAEGGTPVYVAAGGIVTTAEQTPDYGKIAQIDHGSGLEARYAHTSFIAVKSVGAGGKRPAVLVYTAALPVRICILQFA